MDPQIGMRAQSESNWMVKYIAYANKHVTQQQVINDQCEHISYFLIIWDMELLTTQCLLGNFFFFTSRKSGYECKQCFGLCGLQNIFFLMRVTHTQLRWCGVDIYEWESGSVYPEAAACAHRLLSTMRNPAVKMIVQECC